MMVSKRNVLAAAVLVVAACSARAPEIVERPISFSEERQALTRDYIRERYGLTVDDITIRPRMIVLHWTAIDDLDASFRAFDRETLAARPELSGASPVNVSIQFLIAQDGTIHRLMPENWMARHVIGLNYESIGVENVGGANGVDNLTDAQVEANVRLVRYLKQKYPDIEYLIGHHEYDRFDSHPLWRELDPDYRTAKIDPGERFMSAVRAGVATLGLKGAPPAAPPIIPHEEWQAQAPVGYAADATRRNLAPGDSVAFRDLGVKLVAMDSLATLQLRDGAVQEARRVRGGTAFNWHGFHIAVLAVNSGGGLGAGLVELEIATVASLPPHIAAATVSGDATYRLRVPHTIDRITLHHSGSPEPLRPQDDPIAKLRGLQSWGQSDRNWWDVPYHYLIDLQGRIYEGRDHRYMGETNTRYDPSGHLLISVIGNYDLQRPNEAQLESITQLMTWAAAHFDVSPDRIYGHGDMTETSCPGRYLKPYVDDGTFRREVAARLDAAGW